VVQGQRRQKLVKDCLKKQAGHCAAHLSSQIQGRWTKQDHRPKPQAESIRPYLNDKLKQKRTGGMTQVLASHVLGPELKPQYHQKKDCIFYVSARDIHMGSKKR
jgi:hypothetical protein